MLVERKIILNEDQSVGYIETVINSDNILKTTYFPTMQKLYIAFSRGNTYSYSNITEDIYEEFETAESHGKFFHSRINNNKKYPFRKEFTLYPAEISDIRKIIEEKIEDDNE
jgi:hypothetical protein